MLPLALTARQSVAAFLLAAPAFAQIPDGHVVFGSFGSGTGVQGIYFTHPRDTTAQPVAITNLPSDLNNQGTGSRGVAALARRSSDGALLAGERAPAGASVDFWVLRLQGSQVVLAQSYSCGTSAGVGEIPQFGQLPDGRVVIAATDLLAGGQMAHFFNGGGYNWQGLSILNPQNGAFSTIAVSNWNQFVGVMNGMAVSRDGNFVYLGEYISTTAGSLWVIPTAGGTGTIVNLPFGASNVAVDLDGTVLVTTLNGPPNLFRYDPVAQSTTVVTTTTGPLNAIVIESATGNYQMATANGGTPSRSLLWRTPAGPENVLLSPQLGTISSVDVNPNPEVYGAGSPLPSAYAWRLSPNPGGLPLVGNTNFSLTVGASPGTVAAGLFLVGAAKSAPLSVLGIDVLVDPAGAVALSGSLTDTAILPLPLPNQPSLVGAQLFAQSIWIDLTTSSFAASAGVELTVL
jgi:hypothetical protein